MISDQPLLYSTIVLYDMGGTNLINVILSLAECNHWMYYICMPKNFVYGSAASTFWLRFRYNGQINSRDIMENFGYASLKL